MNDTSSAYRRAFVSRASDGEAVCAVEDDFHHFIVTVIHDGKTVTDVRGQAVRYPWTKCPMAVSALTALRGFPISDDPTAIYAYADAQLQCTHMFETACLAVTQAARGAGHRRYDAVVTDAGDGRRIAEVRRNGALAARWVLQNDVLVQPEEHQGKRPGDFRSKLLKTLPPDDAEALLILRRVCFVSHGKGVDADAMPNASHVSTDGHCFVLRPGVAQSALRMRKSIRQFSEAAPPLGCMR